jgi:hypothetical protein
MGVSVLTPLLTPLLARHLASYLELGAAAAVEYRGTLARRVVLALVGLIVAIAAVIAVWTAGLVALWETPWRLGYAATSALVLLVAAIFILRAALGPRPAGACAGALRVEMDKDMELFREWKSTL